MSRVTVRYSIGETDAWQVFVDGKRDSLFRWRWRAERFARRLSAQLGDFDENLEKGAG